MNPLVADLLQVMALERLEINLFRGQSRDVGSPQVYGGQVLGQALSAASATVENRLVHSLHSYFLLPGDFNAPIVYEVDRSRDGSSFSSRRVVAIQHGQPIFHMSASFQTPQEGLEHQVTMPQVPPPEELPDLQSVLAAAKSSAATLQRFTQNHRPIDARPVLPGAQSNADPNVSRIWLRLEGPLPDDEVLNRCLLAYCSDYCLLPGALTPHQMQFRTDQLRLATIDHAMWFHRPVRLDEWLLYAIDTPSATGARGLCRGSIFTRDGRLVASVAQEGLIRLRGADKPK